MPRGLPDYGMYQSVALAAGMADMGELAARLGSINVYDRRGWTFWQDDFEAPVLRWDASFGRGGNRPILSSAFAYMGGQSALLSCGAGIDPSSKIGRGFGLISKGMIGMEFWVQANIDSPAYLEAKLDILDGINNTSGLLKYDSEAGKISIVSGGADI